MTVVIIPKSFYLGTTDELEKPELQYAVAVCIIMCLFSLPPSFLCLFFTCHTLHTSHNLHTYILILHVFCFPSFQFVEYCSSFTTDCPEVLNFLQTKHAKASPDYLSSVEFRNTLGRCLTRAQANRSKTFVYINELCTVLRQHAAKKRKILTKVEPSTSSSSTSQSTSVVSKSKGKPDEENENEEEEEVKPAAEDEQPSTSGLQEDNKEEDQEAERKAKRASRKQVINTRHD